MHTLVLWCKETRCFCEEITTTHHIHTHTHAFTYTQRHTHIAYTHTHLHTHTHIAYTHTHIAYTHDMYSQKCWYTMYLSLSPCTSVKPVYVYASFSSIFQSKWFTVLIHSETPVSAVSYDQSCSSTQREQLTRRTNSADEQRGMIYSYSTQNYW